MKAALEAFRAGRRVVLTKFVANYEGKSLDLSSENLGQVGASAVAKGLQVNEALQVLSLMGNNIGPEGAKAIADMLKENKTVIELRMGTNKIGPAGAEAIANMLKVNQSIERIYIQGDWIPVASFRDGKTTDMDLSGKSYGDLDAIVIASLLTVNNTLVKFDIRGNKIGPAGAAAIANMLKENKECKLAKIDISWNEIGAEGALHIAKALEVNQSIERIYIQGDWIPVASFRDGKTTDMDLSGKSYGDLDAIVIASLLTENKECKLEVLDISSNSIGAEGARHIAKALENKKALRIVETNRSRVAELREFCIRGAARVGVVGPADNTVLFEKGTNLQELVLQSSKIAHHSYFQELLVWISKHQHLRRLQLNAIGLTDDDLSVLISSEDGLTFLEELDLRSNQLTTVPAELGDPKRFGKLQKLLVSRNAELLKRDDELGRRARSDVNVLGVDAGIQVLQLLRLGSSKLKQIPRTRLQLVTVGNFKVGKSTLLERGWLAPSLKRKTAKWSRLERTTSVLLFNCLDSEAGLHWMVRDLPGQPEFYATNLHFLSADCAVFLLVCKATDDERNREQQLRLWLSALDSLGAYHRACCTVLACTHQDQLEPPQLQRTQEWLQQLAPRLSSEFKHAHLDASGMLVDCETEKAPAMLEDLRKRVARAGRNLLSIPDLANVPEFLVVAQDGLAKWRNKHLTKWHASYAEALEIVKSLLPTSAPELVLRELIYQGDVMEFGTELVLSPVWLALALAVIVRPHGHPFYGLTTNRGRVSRQDIQKALLEERWPASMVLRFLQVLDVIAPLSHKPEPLSAATPAPEPTEDSQAVAASPPPLFRQPSFDISSADQVMIPSSVGERYSGVIFAPRDLGFGFGELCLAAGVKFSQRTTSELVFPPGFMAVLAARLLSKKLGPERSASYFGTHEFCFREEDQPHTGDKGAVRAVLDEQGRELFLCVAGSKGFLCHYASSFVQEVLTVLRLPRWGRAEESACVAHLLCQNCLLKGRGPARDTSQASNEICEVLDEQPWATGREGLSVLWGLSRHHDERGQQAKAVVTDNGQKSYFSQPSCQEEIRCAVDAGKVIVPVVGRDDKLEIGKLIGKGSERGLDLGGFDFCTFDRKDVALKDASVKEIVAKVNAAFLEQHRLVLSMPFNGLLARAHRLS
eukprot:g11890.t1